MPYCPQSLLSTDISPSFGVCHALLYSDKRKLTAITESRLKIAYINWKHLNHCTKYFLWKFPIIGYIFHGTLSNWHSSNRVARPFFWSLRFLFLLVITLLLFLATIIHCTKYFLWKFPIIGYIFHGTLSNWHFSNRVARPFFWSLRFLFLLVITLLLFLATILFPFSKLTPFSFTSFNNIHTEMIRAWTSGSFAGWRHFCVCREAGASSSGSAEEHMLEPCSVVFTESKAHARIDGAPGLNQQTLYKE